MGACRLTTTASKTPSARLWSVSAKNWLFSDTVSNATASTNLYSLTETAKANGLEPNAYLRNPLEI